MAYIAYGLYSYGPYSYGPGLQFLGVKATAAVVDGALDVCLEPARAATAQLFCIGAELTVLSLAMLGRPQLDVRECAYVSATEARGIGGLPRLLLQRISNYGSYVVMARTVMGRIVMAYISMPV